MPARGLERFVRFYVEREVLIRGAPIIHPVPARAAPMIEFDFADPVEVLYLDEQVNRKSPSAVVVGPQTHRKLDIQLQGTLKSFVIMFQPDGLQRLYSLPMHELADRSYEARSVIGCSASCIWQMLGDLGSFEERVHVVDEWLLRQSLSSPEVDGISDAANRMIRTGGRVDLTVLACRAGLSTRQFARRFIRQVGLRPKLFARIARFEAALEEKGRFVAKSWTDVAHEFGYFDQMHMVHDFEEFTGATPTGILNQFESIFADELHQVRLRAAASAKSAYQSQLIL